LRLELPSISFTAPADRNARARILDRTCEQGLRARAVSHNPAKGVSFPASIRLRSRASLSRSGRGAPDVARVKPKASAQP